MRRVTVVGGKASWKQRASVAVAYTGTLGRLTGGLASCFDGECLLRWQ